MIGKLTGAAEQAGDRSLVIETGGVGYLVNVLPELAAKARGGQLTLWTYLAVRENALELFGFAHKDELTFFELLVGVPGIGPKSALAILSLAPPATLRQAIVSGKTEYLTKVSGIGRKSAEKIVLELRDKLGKVAASEGRFVVEEDTLEALRSLGYPLREAREALREVAEEITETGERIKAALKILSQKR